MQKAKEKIKRITAMVITLVIILGMTASADVFPDVNYTEPYGQAVEELSELGIMYGDADRNFRPEDVLTRAEATAIVVRVLGLSKAAEDEKHGGVFTDVTEEHWAAGYINLAYKYGFISGFGDGTCKPEELVTFEQMVKMLVAVLGYTPMAENRGGYPVGYLMTASQIGVTKDVKGIASEAIKRKDVAQLVANALDIDMMVQTGFSANAAEYQIIEGKTLRTEYLNAK